MKMKKKKKRTENVCARATESAIKALLAVSRNEWVFAKFIYD